MSELDVLGAGIWGDRFGHWRDLVRGLRDDTWEGQKQLQPERIPARDRRRVPKAVKMAVEVMDQACSMVLESPAPTATVFSSAMGDMDITDYMCKVLAAQPAEISPTRFHNSVHNAATGYWSIATQSHAPANAVSAYLHSAPVALLEAGIQSLEENTPVLLVCQELTAPPSLRGACPTDADFSAALLLAPPSRERSAMARIHFGVRSGPCDWPAPPQQLRAGYSAHPGARLLPLLAAIASPTAVSPATTLAFPLSPHCGLHVIVKSASARDGS